MGYQSKPHSGYWWVIAVGSLVAMGGCGRGDGPEICRVTGVVTRQGKPIPNLFLNFQPTKGRPSWAMTNAEGRFDVKYDAEQDGAVKGHHKIWVAFRPSSPREEFEFQSGKKKMPQDLQAVLDKYGSVATSTLQVEVKQDRQQLELKLD